MLNKNVGDTFSLTLSLEQVNNVIGLAAKLKFDPAVMRPVDLNPAQPGTQVKYQNFNAIPGANPLVSLNRTPSGDELNDGVLNISLAQLPPFAPVNLITETNLIEVEFECVGAGTADVEILAEGTRVQGATSEIEFDTEKSSDVIVEGATQKAVLKVKVS